MPVINDFDITDKSPTETTVYHAESLYRDNSNDHKYLMNNH